MTAASWISRYSPAVIRRARRAGGSSKVATKRNQLPWATFTVSPGGLCDPPTPAQWCSSNNPKSRVCSKPRKPSCKREEGLAEAIRSGTPISQVMAGNYEKHAQKIMAEQDKNVQRASKLDTTSLSDALDRLGIAGQCLNIKPLDPRLPLDRPGIHDFSMDPAGSPPGTVGDYIDDVPVGGVVVLDNGRTRENATVWGDILTWGVESQRHSGNGDRRARARDTHLSRELGYPIYSRSYSMRTGKDRVQVEAMGGNREHRRCARSRQGDILRGGRGRGSWRSRKNTKRPCWLPRNRSTQRSSRSGRMVNDGHTLTEARVKLGYHKLQTKR